MTRRHTAVVLPLVLFSATLLLGAKGWSNNEPQQRQNLSRHFAAVHTYFPSEFHRSVLERLLQFSGSNARRHPYRVAVDSRGRILVTDPGLSVVHVFDAGKRAYWQITGDRHQRLGLPAGLAVDANDDIYVSDLQPPRIVVFRPDGRVARVIGVSVLQAPLGLWVDGQNGKLYAADAGKDQILLFDLQGKLLAAFGTRGTGPGQFVRPQEVVLHRETLVVLDATRLQKFDLKGNLRAVWPLGVDRPTGLAFDRESNLYYVDRQTGNLVAMDLQGNVLAIAGRRRPLLGEPDFYCAQTDAQGDIVAVRSPLQVHVLRLVPDTTP